MDKNKTVFLVALKPISHKFPLRSPGGYIFERELVDENEQGWRVSGGAEPEPVLFAREYYEVFNTREEALIHLDRVATDMVQELEEQESKLRQFINAIDDEIRKK